MLRPCLTCDSLVTDGPRCWRCEHPKPRRSRSTPGRGGGHRAAKFRDAVLAAARMQCEAIEDGQRCDVRGAQHLQAHHAVPISAGGDAHDPDNGRALCRRHHEQAEREALEWVPKPDRGTM